MRRKAYSRAERKQQIIMTLAARIQKGGENKMSAYKLARALDMNASPHFYSILKEMVHEQLLDVEIYPNPGKWVTWYWSLPKGSYTPPKKSHTIAVKTKGRVVGQMELFS